MPRPIKADNGAAPSWLLAARERLAKEEKAESSKPKRRERPKKGGGDAPLKRSGSASMPQIGLRQPARTPGDLAARLDAMTQKTGKTGSPKKGTAGVAIAAARTTDELAARLDAVTGRNSQSPSRRSPSPRRGAPEAKASKPPPSPVTRDDDEPFDAENPWKAIDEVLAWNEAEKKASAAAGAAARLPPQFADARADASASHGAGGLEMPSQDDLEAAAAACAAFDENEAAEALSDAIDASKMLAIERRLDKHLATKVADRVENVFEASRLRGRTFKTRALNAASDRVRVTDAAFLTGQSPRADVDDDGDDGDDDAAAAARLDAIRAKRAEGAKALRAQCDAARERLRAARDVAAEKLRLARADRAEPKAAAVDDAEGMEMPE